jgi:hemerythrin-like domain-containing protein
MNTIDHFQESRQMFESVLGILEILAGRLNMGEPFPNAVLGEAVEFLREFEDATSEAREFGEGPPCSSGSIDEHETAHVFLRRMQWALESLEHGEAGAAGAFVRSAREYIRTYRDHARETESYFPLSASERLSGAESQVSDIERMRRGRLRQRFSRLLERYRHLSCSAIS